MSSRTPYLSALVLLCAAFPAQVFRVGLAMTVESAPSPGRLRHLLARAWLPAGFVLVAALVWYVAPSSGVTRLPPAWIWYPAAVALGLAAPAVEVATGAAVALLRRQRVRRVRLHERWDSGTGAGGGARGLAAAGVVAVVVAAAEEVIFRGVGVHLLVRDLGWPAALAVAVTAAGYGLNHLYFGWLTVLQKAVTGVLLGAAFLASGYSLLVPLLAHATQNLAVVGFGARSAARAARHTPPVPGPVAAGTPASRAGRAGRSSGSAETVPR